MRHFLACCSQNAEGQETSVEISVAGEGFSAQGLIITARNYLDVFPYDKWSDKVCVCVCVTVCYSLCVCVCVCVEDFSACYVQTIPAYQQSSTFQPTSIEVLHI